MDRTLEILELVSTNSYITATEIADKLNVSSRTIRNDIDQLNSDLKNKGAFILTKPRKGIILEITNQHEYETYKESLKNHLIHDNGDVDGRVQQIIEYMITTDDSIRMDDLCEILYVSRSTLKNDLKIVRDILKKYDISIDYHANQGMKIIGDEKQLRLCLARTKMEIPVYRKEFPNENLEIIRNIIDSEIEKYHFGISDLSINNLIIHVYIAIKRIKSGKVIQVQKSFHDELKNDNDLEMTMEIVNKIEKEFDVKFPQSEIYYILIHLSGKKIISLNKYGTNTVIQDDIYKMVILMLEEVHKTFKIDLRYDLELITLLSLHLVPFKIRLLNDLSSYNPLMDNIRSHYMLAYNMAVLACEKLHKKYNKRISSDEIAYIALHFNVALERKRNKKKEKVLIVCGSGRGSAELLSYQVKEKFGNYLDVVETTSAFYLENIDFNQVDYILTTVPIKEKVPVPIIKINTFLESNEIQAVHKVMNETHGNRFLHYFKEDLIFKMELDNKYEILELLCKKASKIIDIPDGFFEAVLKREEMGHTSFGNLICIPHPIRPMGNESFVAIGILTKPVLWDEEKVQLVFLLSMKQSGDDKLQDFYKIMSRIISNKKYINEFIHYESFDELQSILKEIILTIK